MFYSPTSQPVAVLLTAIIPALLLNIYIVGVNQYFDIQIDRINKPYLPLASGALTKPDAQLTIALSAVIGLLFCLAPLATPALRVVLIGSAILGTIYSAPPFRLKRFALLASILILTVRGLLVNIGFFLHSSASNVLPPVIVFASAFFTFFGIVIALLKDVPDTRGDMVFGIRTFSVRMGVDKVFNACVCTLVLMFVAAAAFYLRITHSPIGLLIAGVHVLVACKLWQRSRLVSTNAPKQLYEYYMFSWKMFYLEYALLPFLAF